MSIVVIGVNHRTAPIDLLERVSVSGPELAKAITGLVSRANIREAAVLSTCNRTEVFAVAERFHGAYADIRDFFCELGGMQPDELHPHLYSQHDDAAVSHLFEVAAGLDSAVLGESEILGQVRSAWEIAQAEGGTKATLNLLFRHAIETGKRARPETSIGRHTASVSHAAVEMAHERLGGIAGRRVLVVGAGEMGEGIAVALVGAGATDITVTNRTQARAAQLAQRVSGNIVPFSQLGAALREADVLLTCTGAGTIIIDHELVVAARLGISAAEADRVRSIVGEEVERFGLEATARQAAPLVAQLHEKADHVRLAELERFANRLASLEPAQREAVEAVTKGIVAKMLHQLSVRLKDDAGTPQGERNAAAVRDLFDLG